MPEAPLPVPISNEKASNPPPGSKSAIWIFQIQRLFGVVRRPIRYVSAKARGSLFCGKRNVTESSSDIRYSDPEVFPAVTLAHDSATTVHKEPKYIGIDFTGKVEGDLVRKAGGNYSDIYIGHLHDGTTIAIKRFRFACEADERIFTERVTRELYTWFELDHSNILSLKGIIKEDRDTCPSFVTDWMENGSLQQYIQKGPVLDKLTLLEGITRGLLYLHERDIVHGDLKPSNIIISPSGSPMLTDFGFLRLLSGTMMMETATKSEKGSVRWHAPEMLHFSGADDIHTKESDMWALGMIYYMVMTKDLPYANLTTDGSVITRLLNSQLPSAPSGLEGWSGSDKKLWNLHENCCRFEPSQRSTAADLVEQIQQIKLDFHAP